jgi:hypothetical protein
MRKPDAGNLHVRFDEGEGTQRSLALRLSSRASLSTLPDSEKRRLLVLLVHSQCLAKGKIHSAASSQWMNSIGQ